LDGGTAISSGKSSGHALSDIETMGSGTAEASPSSEAATARADDARTFATSAERAASSRCLPSWWMGAAAIPGSISSIRRRSTTRWSADAVTATAQPK
jgi:hypothetical protein